ncbi:MAG: hypothetical protein M3007_04250 [Candidatus Eremiobacteraeota bacterium]|nr:hypothetical protein [Candidatus Eremiobacteraeota bacterium]
MNGLIAGLSLGLLVFALLLALWMSWRNLPRAISKQERDMFDHLREEIRGKPFDDLSTIQKAWSGK